MVHVVDLNNAEYSRNKLAEMADAYAMGEPLYMNDRTRNRLTIANTAYGFVIQMLRPQFPIGSKSLSNYTALIDIKDGKAYITIQLKKG